MRMLHIGRLLSQWSLALFSEKLDNIFWFWQTFVGDIFGLLSAVTYRLFTGKIIMSQSMTQANSDVGESKSRSTAVRRHRKTSPVWLHFRQVGAKAFCNHCSIEFAAGPGSGTTHLHRHIGVCQKIDEVERERWLALSKDTDFFGAPNYKFDPILSRNLMTLFFIDVEILFNVIERIEITMKEFEGLDSRVSFTSDIWTSSMHLGYLCLTAHFIDKDFKFQKKIISFKQIPYPHMGVNVAGLIKNTLTEWKLDGEIFTITLDNCAVNDVAVGLLEKHFWEKTIFKGKYMHMRCAAHILNIMVQCGMKIISPSLILIRDLIRNIALSGSKLQLFNDKLKYLNLPSEGFDSRLSN
ncbi:zinc finger BED domain-containing protein RICESLEEPER 2-like [Carex rostrata]